ncbi:hypothetical protein [Aeoliella sp.]|uniref:hypothetical protein n=1 Tax=Aeoliella sp. TaxID=2795800 RepID=UPI003CCB78C8
MFDRLDRDDDGSLSKEEFAVVQRIMRRMGPSFGRGPGAAGPRGFGGPPRDGDRPAGPRADRDDDDRPSRGEARRGGRGFGPPGARGRGFGRPESDDDDD